MAVATFKTLLFKDADKTKSIMNNPLGPYKAFEPGAFNISETNAVELQFAIDPAGRGKYRSLKAVQWAAPQSLWFKLDNPFQSTWIQRDLRTGDDPDNPLDANTKESGQVFAYWDCPGPSVTKWLGIKVSRLYAVQNFKAYPVGVTASGTEEQLCDLVCWCSIVDMINPNLGDSSQAPAWQRVKFNDARLGWADTTVLPPF